MNDFDFVGTPIVIGNLEIAQFDFPSAMLWSDAISECEKFGNSWRLPTIEEWATILQPNRYLIGVAEKHEMQPNAYPPPPRSYWSSSHNLENIKYWSFHYGEQINRNQYTKYFVRVVRSV